VLIDDRADNCATFTAQGGTAIQWKMGASNITNLATQLRQWLNTAIWTTASSAPASS
jgi:hypothetical protein